MAGAVETATVQQCRTLGVLEWRHSSVVVARVRWSAVHRGRGRQCELRLLPLRRIPAGPKFLLGLLAEVGVHLFVGLDRVFYCEAYISVKCKQRT